MKKTIGFIINPIAGIGGKVGLKGSDNVSEEAKKRGGKEISAQRAADFFKNINTGILNEFYFLTCSGKMGGEVIKKFTKNYEIKYFPKKDKTTAGDTKN